MLSTLLSSDGSHRFCRGINCHLCRMLCFRISRLVGLLHFGTINPFPLDDYVSDRLRMANRRRLKCGSCSQRTSSTGASHNVHHSHRFTQKIGNKYVWTVCFNQKDAFRNCLYCLENTYVIIVNYFRLRLRYLAGAGRRKELTTPSSRSE